MQILISHYNKIVSIDRNNSEESSVLSLNCIESFLRFLKTIFLSLFLPEDDASVAPTSCCSCLIGGEVSVAALAVELTCSSETLPDCSSFTLELADTVACVFDFSIGVNAPIGAHFGLFSSGGLIFEVVDVGCDSMGTTIVPEVFEAEAAASTPLLLVSNCKSTNTVAGLAISSTGLN